MMCGPELIQTHILELAIATGLMEIVKGLHSLTPPRLSLSGSADAATKSYHSSFGSVSTAGFKRWYSIETLDRECLFHCPGYTVFTT